MGFFHPTLMHDPGQADRSRPAEVRRVAAGPREVPVWNGLRLAQSSAGPSFGIGSSAGPVGGSINPYTAVPGSSSAGSGAASEVTGRSVGSDTPGGFLGTQQEQGGGAGGSSGAASPSSSGVSPTRTAVPTSGEPANHTGPGAADRGALGAGNRGARLMDTGDSVKTPPPASLTDKPPARSAGSRPSASRPRPAPAARPASTGPPTDTTPPPPPPAETGIGSTR